MAGKKKTKGQGKSKKPTAKRKPEVKDLEAKQDPKGGAIARTRLGLSPGPVGISNTRS